MTCRHDPHLLKRLLIALVGVTAFAIGCADTTITIPAEGTEGDPCFRGNTCLGTLVCNDIGICEVLNGCTPGANGCPCTDEGACLTPSYDCDTSNTCTSDEGSLGNACYSNRTCDTGLLCDSTQTCVGCEAGSIGCACLGNGTCGSGLECRNATCVEENTVLREVPSNPVCYSPCRASFTDSLGNFRACSADRLMAGCLDGFSCVSGSCVEAGQQPPTCAADVNCPAHQRCIQGLCYSDCEYDSDCQSMERCFQHACRLPCSDDAEACPDNEACELTDGEFGYCMPVSEPGALAQESVDGSFRLSSRVLSFTNTSIQHLLTITNESPRTLDFFVRKLEETQFTDSGAVTVTTNPAPWLRIGAPGAAAAVNEYMVRIPAGQDRTVELVNATSGVPTRWEGVMEVENELLGSQRLDLHYAATPDGRWAGDVYYFGQFGDRNLDAWAQNPSSPSALSAVGNAFIQKWGALRRGFITLEEFNAALTSTIEGSWRWPSVESDCATAACYPNAAGVERYSDDLQDQPIPTGIAQLPFAMDIRAVSGGTAYSGRIASEQALQYAGDPTIDLAFSSDPAGPCPSSSGTTCLNYLSNFNSRTVVGGRYRTDASDANCRSAPDSSTFQLQKTPWILPGFLRDTTLDESTGLRYTYECRDTTLPFGGAAENAATNGSLAGSNPIPDGNARVRELQMLDGALINQETLVLIFRERFRESFFGDGDTEGFSAYGVIVLERSNAQLSASSFLGNSQDDGRISAVTLGDNITCSPGLVEQVFGTSGSVGPGNAAQLANTLINGLAPAGGAPAAYDSTAAGGSQIHYLCHQNGLFDQGSFPNGQGGSVATSCPAGSGVTYFAGADVPGDLSTFACQQDGTCDDTLQEWIRAEQLHLNPVWNCIDTNEVYCDSDRIDLRNGKRFFRPGTSEPVFVPLLAQIDNAFRYKTRFRTRQGGSVGFAPEICVPNSNVIPYCYDAAEIELIRDRVDCLTHLFSAYYPQLFSAGLADEVRNYLVSNFSFDQEIDPTLPLPIIHDGFERLNSELLIMLGDEAYTGAFQSRFDLAGSSIVSFEGELFEPGGINLSGVAGYEMFLLYQAAQYYQSVTDRFYSLSPRIWESVAPGTPSARSFIGQDSVLTYFNRVLRASTQRARAWSEVGRRYQALNRPDLARFVLERAYTSAYLESIILSRMMQRVVDISSAEERDQIRMAIETAFTTYRAALLDMRNAYAQFTDEVTYFGFAPDYIPMPALEPHGPNAFEAVMVSAQQSLARAAEDEEVAINSNRSFETDAAAFQSELAQIRNTYENQLADICGTFEGDDGLVYPAIGRYAYLNERARLLGDPCGLMGNGAIHQAIGQAEVAATEIDRVQHQFTQLTEQVRIEAQRASDICGITIGLADYRYDLQGEVNSAQTDVAALQTTMARLSRQRQVAGRLAELRVCATGPAADSCVASNISQVIFQVASAGFESSQQAVESQLDGAQRRIAELQRGSIRVEAASSCEQVRVNSAAQVRTSLLALGGLEIDALRSDYGVRLSLSEITRLRNQAERLQAEQSETQQLSINVEAARNDPNVRIYRNDAIINSDRSFFAALRQAYRATRVFEYYTSQSYPEQIQLGLIRLIARGDYNLDNYLADLNEAYYEFQETYGRPDTRVEVLSMRDDVLAIPFYDESGRTLTQAERVELFREALTDTRNLDVRGYTSIPFATSFDALSPLTRNHKILYMESEIIGSDVGDTVARIYVGQAGTSTVNPLDGSFQYYRLPERTAVTNPFLNGTRVFTPEVYRSDRLRDRPFANSSWELVFNQRDERANQDVNLNALTDIRLYVYYTDFTAI